MSMSLDRAITWQSRLVQHTAEIVGRARMCGQHSNQMQANKISTMNNAPKGLPRHVHEYVRGYYQALVDQLYVHDLEFCYLYQGRLYSTHRQSSRPTTQQFYDREQGNLLVDCPSGHFWKGTDKVFFGVDQEIVDKELGHADA